MKGPTRRRRKIERRVRARVRAALTPNRLLGSYTRARQLLLRPVNDAEAKRVRLVACYGGEMELERERRASRGGGGSPQTWGSECKRQVRSRARSRGRRCSGFGKEKTGCEKTEKGSTAAARRFRKHEKGSSELK